MIALAVTLSLSTVVRADDDGAGVGFEIKPLFSSTQIDRNRGHFYIQTSPGEEQELNISVRNISKEEKTFEVLIQNGVSQSDGNIGYTEDLEKIHETLINPITEIVVAENNEFTLASGEEEIVRLKVTPPKDSYDGIKVGKVVVREKSEKEEQGISQKFEYGLGILTAESGIAYNDGSELLLVDSSAKANINLGSRVIEASIVNPQPKTIEKLEVTSYVTKKGDDKKIKEKNIKDFAFAPNSVALYDIPWGLQNFESGEYTFHFKGKNDFEEFDLKQDFVIRADDAKRLNKEVAFSVRTSKTMKIVIISLNALLVVLCGVVIVRNKKWITEIKSKKKRQRKTKKAKRKN